MYHIYPIYKISARDQVTIIGTKITTIQSLPKLKTPTAILMQKQKTNVFHRIETGSRQLSAQEFNIAKDEFRKHQNAEITSPSKSE